MAPIHAHNGIELNHNIGVLIGAISNTGLRAGAIVGTGVAIETFVGSITIYGVGVTVGICVGKLIFETIAPVRSGIKSPPINVTIVMI